MRLRDLIKKVDGLSGGFLPDYMNTTWPTYPSEFTGGVEIGTSSPMNPTVSDKWVSVILGVSADVGASGPSMSLGVFNYLDFDNAFWVTKTQVVPPQGEGIYVSMEILVPPGWIYSVGATPQVGASEGKKAYISQLMEIPAL